MEALVRIALFIVGVAGIVMFYALAYLGLMSLGYNWIESLILLILLCIIITLSLVAFMKGLE